MTSTFCINTSRIAHQTVDGETIVIDFENGAYYSTEGAGAVIWELIAKGATFEQILEVVTGRYRSEPPTAEDLIARFLAELEQASLISRVPARADTSRFEPSTFYSTGEASTSAVDLQPPVLHKYTDMQDLLLIDPIHDVEAQGWPAKREGEPV